MTRRLTIAVAILCLCLGAFLLPALSQAPVKIFPPPSADGPKANEAILAVMRQLKQPMNVKEMQDQKFKFGAALHLLAAKAKVNFIVDRPSFAEDAGAADIHDKEVILPPGTDIMPVELVLRLLLAQVGDGEASFWIHPLGYVNISHKTAMIARYSLYKPSILGNFDERPLREVLNDLSNRTATPIYLDSEIGKKSETPISALFNNQTLEQALVAVTEIVHLKYVVLEGGIFVTTAENAKVIEKEEKARTAARESFLIARKEALAPGP